MQEHITTPTLDLGDYQLQIADNQLCIISLSAPDHTQWVSTLDGKLLEASLTTLRIIHGRSSYKINERIK